MFETYPRVIIAFYVQSCVLRFSTILISSEHRSWTMLWRKLILYRHKDRKEWESAVLLQAYT